MPARYFLDTNIFIYCFDREDQRKQNRADTLVSEAIESHLGVISTQVVQEFLNIATTKFTPAMNRNESGAYLDAVLFPLCEVYPTIVLYREALDLQATTGYSFYDSLVIAAALAARCSILYSEDLQDGQTIRDLKIVNPFQTIPAGSKSLESAG
jgi:predicted nucleic acid-binding protein